MDGVRTITWRRWTHERRVLLLLRPTHCCGGGLLSLVLGKRLPPSAFHVSLSLPLCLFCLPSPPLFLRRCDDLATGGGIWLSRCFVIKKNNAATPGAPCILAPSCHFATTGLCSQHPGPGSICGSSGSDWILIWEGGEDLLLFRTPTSKQYVCPNAEDKKQYKPFSPGVNKSQRVLAGAS